MAGRLGTKLPEGGWEASQEAHWSLAVTLRCKRRAGPGGGEEPALGAHIQGSLHAVKPHDQCHGRALDKTDAEALPPGSVRAR